MKSLRNIIEIIANIAPHAKINREIPESKSELIHRYREYCIHSGYIDPNRYVIIALKIIINY